MPHRSQGAEFFDDGTGQAASGQRALDEVFSLVYEELRRLASFVRKSEAKATINSTALVHEAWMKLKDTPALASKSTLHFKAIAARAMRQVLVDEARRRNARKRGGEGEATWVTLDESAGEMASRDEELLSLDKALEELAQMNPRQARVVEGRFFGGLNIGETAAMLDVSESVVERDWRAARAWLANKIRSETGLS